MTLRVEPSERVAPVQFATTDDGYRIAYSVSGEGEPFVFMPCLLQNDIAHRDEGKADFLEAIARRYRLVQYDGRGTGNSTRGVDPNVKIEDTARDLLAVIDDLHLDRFVLYGDVFDTYTAFTVAIQLQAQVKALVLVCPQDFKGEPLMAQWAAMYTTSWELFTNTFTKTFVGLAGWSGRDMREAVDHKDFVNLAMSARGRHLSDLLPRVKTPVLIVCQQNPTIPSTHADARQIASAIPGAEFVILDGHRVSDFLRNSTAGVPPVMPVIDDFLARIDDCRSYGVTKGELEGRPQLSSREIEVLRLLAAGRSNPQIAAALFISSNTVAKHVTSILSKTGTTNRTEAAVFARDHYLV